MARLSRRHFLTTSGAAVLATGAPRIAAAQTAVKVGTAVLGDYALAGPFIVAADKGFFRTENLTVEYIPFRGGPNLVKAVISGDVLLGAAGSTDILVFREAGMPLKMVATQTEGNHFTFNVAPDVKGPEDVKGKAIGVTSIGATTWVFARMFAKAQGWEPDKDVKIVALGGLDAQMAALARKEIAAYVWGDGGAVMWPLLVGVNRAKYMLMTGDLIPGEEAFAMGVVNQVVDEGEAVNAALALAQRLAKGAPYAIQSSKASVNKIIKAVSNLVLPLSLAMEEISMTKDDAREAASAFQEKREPRFTGR